MKNAIQIVCVAALSVITVATALGEAPYEVEWIAQIGSDSTDESHSVAVDGAGNAYICGWTQGSLAGPYGADVYEGFLSKFDSGGAEVWSRQVGVSIRDNFSSVVVDADGNPYVAGSTYGDLGGPNAGNSDAFVRKYDSGGEEVWTTQIGGSDSDLGTALALDASGNSYITGWTYNNLGGMNAGYSDVFVSKLDSGGNKVWTSQIGSSESDTPTSIAVDAYGNTYVAGLGKGTFGGGQPRRLRCIPDQVQLQRGRVLDAVYQCVRHSIRRVCRRGCFRQRLCVRTHRT